MKRKIINLMDLDIISCFFTKKQHIDVYRDKHGRAYSIPAMPEDYLSEERILNRFIVILGLRWAGKDICIAASEI